MHPLSLVSVKFSSAALALKLVLVLATLFFTSSAWLSAIVAVLSGALLCAACAYWPPYFRLTGPPLPSGGNNARIEDTGAKPWTQEAAPGDDMAVPELALIGGDVVAVDDPAAAPAALPLAAKTTDSGSACGRCCRGAMSAALHYGSTNLTRLALCLGVFWMYVRGAQPLRALVLTCTLFAARYVCEMLFVAVEPGNAVVDRLPIVFLVVVVGIVLYHAWGAWRHRRRFAMLKAVDDSALAEPPLRCTVQDLVRLGHVPFAPHVHLTLMVHGGGCGRPKQMPRQLERRYNLPPNTVLRTQAHIETQLPVLASLQRWELLS